MNFLGIYLFIKSIIRKSLDLLNGSIKRLLMTKDKALLYRKNGGLQNKQEQKNLVNRKV